MDEQYQPNWAEGELDQLRASGKLQQGASLPREPEASAKKVRPSVMFSRLNRWARSWGPVIALATLVVTVIAVIVALVQFTSPNGTNHYLNETIKKQESDYYSSPNNPTENSRDQHLYKLPDTGISQPARDNFAELSPLDRDLASLEWADAQLDPLTISLSCDRFLDRGKYRQLTGTQRDKVHNACLRENLNEQLARHFVEKLHGKEEDLIQSLPRLSQELKDISTLLTTTTGECLDPQQEGIEEIVYAAFLSIAAKAFIIAQTSSLGSEVIERLKSSAHPLDSLPAEKIFGALPEPQIPKEEIIGSFSYKVLLSYRPDVLLNSYSDEEVIRLSQKALNKLPQYAKKRVQNALQLHLAFYESHQLEKKSDLFDFFRSTTQDALFVEIISPPFLGNFPSGKLFQSCADKHIGRFWLRRMIGRTHKRVYKLGKKLMNSLTE